jgi:hypothetical protein
MKCYAIAAHGQLDHNKLHDAQPIYVKEINLICLITEYRELSIQIWGYCYHETS